MRHATVLATARLPLLLAFLLPACDDGPSDAADTGPVALASLQVQLEPAEPHTSDDLVATVSGHDGGSLRYEWTVDGTPRPEFTSATVPAAKTSKKQTWAVTVSLRDSEAAPASASAQILNTVPTAELTLTPDPARSGNELLADVRVTDPDGDEIELRYAWTVDGTPITLDGPSIPGVNVVTGQVWAVTVTPTDGEAEGEPVQGQVEVLNGPPVITAAWIDTPATRAQALQAHAEATDADGDTFDHAYTWVVGGVPVPDVDGPSLGTEHFERGDAVTVQVVSTDAGGRASDPFASPSVLIQNALPSITDVVLSPLSPTANTGVTCGGMGFHDPDGDPASWTYAWTVNGVAVAATGATLATGISDGDLVTCTLTPRDGIGSGTPLTSAPITVGNAAPTILTGSLDPAAPASTDDIELTGVTATDPDGDDVTWTTTWFVDGVQIDVQGDTLPAAHTAPGQVIHAEIRGHDGTSEGEAFATSSVTVTNTAPVFTALAITPTSPGTGQDVLATPVASDPDGQELTFTYDWYVDGSLTQTGASPELDSSHYSRGDLVYVSGTASDGIDSTGPVISISVTVANTAPVVTAVLTDPTDASASDDITCLPEADDPDGDLVTWTYAWKKNGVLTSETTDVFSATSLSQNDTIQCLATPHDGLEAGEQGESPALVVGNGTPSLSGVSIDEDPVTTGIDLHATATGASDPDGDTVTVSWSWTVDGVEVSHTDSLDASEFSEGDIIVVTATPNDGLQDGFPVASTPVTALNGPPEVTGVTLSPTGPTVLVDLTASATFTDPDDDPADAWSWSWTRNGTVIVGVTGDTLSSGFYQRGDVISVAAQVDDGTQTSDWVSSANVTILNAPPTITGVTMTPTEVYEATELSCSASGWFDADGDANASTPRWVINGVPGILSDTLDGTWFDRGDTVACRIEPNDGIDTGEAITTAAVTVGNTAPSVAGVTLSDLLAASDEDITATIVGGVDVDGDPITWAHAWYVGGNLVSTEATLDASLTARGDAYYLQLTPSDDTLTGNTVTSLTGTVVNSAPVIESVQLAPSAPTTTSPLVASVVASDADGDALSYTYAWYVGGQLVSGVTGDTLPASHHEAGDQVWVEATASDGIDTTDPVLSLVVTIENTPPSVAAATISPTVAYESTVLSCTGTGWYDVDGDAEGYQYVWRVNGQQVGTGDQLTGADFDKDDVVTCVLTPDDGEDPGTPVTSAGVTILNSAPTLATMGLSNADPTTATNLTVVTTGENDPDGDTYTRTVQWYVNGTLVHTGDVLASSHIERGDVVYAVLTLDDGDDADAWTSPSTTVVNALPVVTTAVISPSQPRVTDTFSVAVTSSDADGDPVTYSYQWLEGGLPLAGQTSSTLSGSVVSKGDVVSVRITPNDGLDDGVAYDSAEVTVLNSTPTLDDALLGPDPAYTDTPITCTATNPQDADGDFVQVQYDWTVDGLSAPASTATLATNLFHKGDAVVCTATPYDSEVLGTPVVSSALTVSNAPPVLGGISLNATTPTENSVLIVTEQDVSDADGDIVTFEYAWSIGGVVVSTAPSIDGDTFDRGDSITLTVTPTDGEDDGTPVSGGPWQVVNAAPTLTSAPAFNKSNPRASDDVIVAAAFDDADGDPVTLDFAFSLNGTVVQTGPSNTLAASYVVGDTIQVTVTATDGLGGIASATSSTITVRNTVPTAPVASIRPLAISHQDTLTCEVVTPSVDDDGESLLYTYAFKKNGVAYSTATTDELSATLVLPSLSHDATFSCVVSAADATASGANSAVVSTSVVAGVMDSCDDFHSEGYGDDGVYQLQPSGGDSYLAWCDQNTQGGGWTRVIRTEGSDEDYGQESSSIISSYADVEDDVGVYDAFERLADFDYIMLMQVEGDQAGDYRHYALSSAGGHTLLEMMEECRDETTSYSDDTTFDGVRTLGHTSDYSGLALSGGSLVVYHTGLATTRTPTYVFVCGINESSNNDVSYLAFTSSQGDSNTWSNAWRGTGQIDTIWSFANNDYSFYSYLHIGGGTMEALAGWKGVGHTTAELWHEGTYEIYVK